MRLPRTDATPHLHRVSLDFDRLDAHLQQQQQQQQQQPAVVNNTSDSPFGTIAASQRGTLGHDDHVTCVAMSHNSRVVATGALDSTCMLWETQHMRLVHVLAAHASGVGCLRFSPDDAWLVTCGGFVEPVIKLWHVAQWTSGSITTTSLLHDHLAAVQQAMAPQLSMQVTSELLTFDAMLPTIVPNHDWIFHRPTPKDIKLKLD